MIKTFFHHKGFFHLLILNDSGSVSYCEAPETWFKRKLVDGKPHVLLEWPPPFQPGQKGKVNEKVSSSESLTIKAK